MIIFNKVTKKFNDGTLVLDEVSFSIEKGEFVFLVGPSGAGKTTISRLLIKEFSPSKGRVFVDNEEITKLKKSLVPQLRRKIGVAFQDFKVLSDRTVEENISLALEITHHTDAQIRERISKLLTLVGLEGKQKSFPRELSGGELQRVVIARALAHQPKILFADEPTGNLDQDTGWQIIDLLRRINEQGTTVIVATHNQSFIDSFKRRVITLKQGKIVKDEKEKKEPKPEKKKELKEKKNHGTES